MKTLSQFKPALLIIPFAIAVFACSNWDKSADRKATNQLIQYVDSVNNSDKDYTYENWSTIENGYNIRVSRADMEVTDMTEAEKAELNTTKQKYAELKAKYEMELAKNNSIMESKLKLRKSLFGEGVIGDDMDFTFVTSNNVRSTYQTFVDAVDANKDTYSREDWDEIKLLYEALDTRKNAVEKELSAEDNRAIAALKVRMATIFTVNRPVSKSQENSDAKM